MHIVHQKETADNQTRDDYAVLGIFFDIQEGASIDDKPNKALQKIADAFIDINYQGTDTSLLICLRTCLFISQGISTKRQRRDLFGLESSCYYQSNHSKG